MVEHLYELNTLGMRESALLKIRGVELNADREIRSNRGANGLHCVQQQPRAVFEGTAPSVGTAIGQRARELREKIAMCGVKLHAGKACIFALLRGERELLYGLCNIRLCHFPRRRKGSKGPRHIQLHTGRSQWRRID